MTLVAALCGLCAAAGLLLIVDGIRRKPRPAPERRFRRPTRAPRDRMAASGALGLGLLVATRWPVAAVSAAALGWFWPELFGGRAARERAVARTEAIATWTEMLRDTLSGAHGLEEAIVTSAGMAPPPIRPELTALAVRLEREPLDRALRAFGDELAHPTGDLVVTALLLAAGGASADLRELLGTLALAAREEAAMRLRVEATRARLRTAVRVIAGVTATTALGLIVLNRAYLDVYSGLAGQTVLASVGLIWAGALWWLTRMSRFLTLDRFLTTGEEMSA